MADKELLNHYSPSLNFITRQGDIFKCLCTYGTIKIRINTFTGTVRFKIIVYCTMNENTRLILIGLAQYN